MKRHIAVLGPMGVGKTTTAAAVAARLGLPRRDSDQDIESRAGRPGRAIAAAEGVARLHELEAQVLLDALADATPSVIAAAASVVDREDCREALRAHALVVVLALDTDALIRRMETGDHRRAISANEIEALLHRRAPVLAAIADVHLDASRPTSDLVAAIVDAAAPSASPAGPDEIVLEGGLSNPGAVVRVGDTVCRPARPHTSTVQAFLGHLRAEGLAFVPEPRGLDSSGREQLSYIEGSVAIAEWEPWVMAEPLLESVAESQRRLHRAAASFVAPPDATWAAVEAADWYFPDGSAGELVCHNDLGVINVVVDRGTVVGIIDWELARPADRLFDIAVAARHWCPLAAPQWRYQVARGVDVARRFRIFCDVHELDGPERSRVVELLQAILERTVASVPILEGSANPALRALVGRGYETALRDTLDWLAEEQSEILRA